ncbi:MAG: SDR family oxidoreductase [Alphaproteobacteria bacterium]
MRCNAIRPGWIMTGMADAAFATAKDVERAKRDALARHAAGRFGEPADIAAAALWLVSRRSRLRHRPVHHRRRRSDRGLAHPTGTFLMADPNHTAVLGAGVIGASWTALFLAAGKSVAVFDVADDVEKTVRAYVANAWPTLTDLGMTRRGDPEAVTFCSRPVDAVDRAAFVQESVPERLALKHALYAEIEEALDTDAVIASSASGLTLSEMQAGWRDPSRLVLGHPFNPPHLIPLVEVMGNDRTAAGVVEAAERFYADVGKVTIRVNKEVPGHVANRLQAAIWREALHLIKEGVASVEDVDKAVSAGPGLRWAGMGPTTLFHLAAGEGGIEAFCARYGESFHRWWADLGDPRLDDAMRSQLVDGIAEATGGRSIAELAAERDAVLLGILKALKAR